MDRRSSSSTRRKRTPSTGSAAKDTLRARAREDAEDTADDGSDGSDEAHGIRAANARKKQMTALDMRSMGHTFDEIAAKCGFTHRSAARKAWQAAIKTIAEDTVEEARLQFKASYGPVRQAMHKRARMGDVRAVEALVKLDERECRLFGLDISPEDASLHVQYTKRIVLEEPPMPAPAPSVSESESAA